MTDENSDTPDVDWSALDSQFTEGGVAPPKVINEQMLAKRLVWDVAPCADAVHVAERLGLTPASEDVEDKEHEESHARLTAVRDVLPFLVEMSRHAAPAAVGSVVVNGPDISDEDLTMSINKMIPVIYQTSWAILAELVDIGVVHMPHYSWKSVTPGE